MHRLTRIIRPVAIAALVLAGSYLGGWGAAAGLPVASWSTPSTAVAGNAIPAALWNSDVRDNTTVLREGGIAIASQAAGDVIYASGATQLARLPIGSAGEVLTVNSGGAAPEWSSGLPSGVVLPYGGSSAPSGYLLADGSAVSRTTYAALFAIYGTTFGAGDGSTTFNLPDLRQRFPLGKAVSGTGNTLGGTGGSIDHSHTYNTVIAHTHTITDPGHEHASVAFDTSTSGSTGGGSDYWSGAATVDGETVTTGITGTNSAGSASGTTSTTNAPYLVLNYIVKV